jgi:hypothetical protein
MALQQISMQVNGASVTAQSTANNHGTMLGGGSPSALNSVGLGYSDVGVFGSSVTDNNSADKALSAGTFSYNNQKPVAKRVTTKLSGVNNTYLQSGAAKPGNIRSIHKLEVLRTRKITTAIRAGDWNIYRGVWTNEPTNVVDTLDTDNAANPTREVPGRLTYIGDNAVDTVLVPKNDVYKEKTN